MIVETVCHWAEFQATPLIYRAERRREAVFFTFTLSVEVPEPTVPGKVFHFSASPTVTTSFIAFAFDIRGEQK
jgi:hypothetical protein